ncbi:MAG: hypothetical protein DBX55_08275 [Verrucomicrobia bacterium]|nr:MAG: hypothetical protein DBX55_08275 [Verrucomicrobiota bacterium]
MVVAQAERKSGRLTNFESAHADRAKRNPGEFPRGHVCQIPRVYSPNKSPNKSLFDFPPKKKFRFSGLF